MTIRHRNGRQTVCVLHVVCALEKKNWGTVTEKAARVDICLSLVLCADFGDFGELRGSARRFRCFVRLLGELNLLMIPSE